MTTVITGASGHVGANLVRALIARGQPIRCLMHRSHRALDGLDAEVVRGDILDTDSLVDAFRGAATIYHLAARISLDAAEEPEVMRINVEGTRNVIAACRRAGVKRLVHFSSIHALDQEPFATPVDESRPRVTSHRCPPYDRSKAAAEELVRRAIADGLDAVIINPTAVLGPYDYQPSYIGEAILNMAQRRLPALVTGGFDWVDVRDVVAGAMVAAEKAPPGAAYLLSGHWVSMCDIAAMVAGLTGAAPPKFVCPLWLARASAPLIQGLSRLSHRRPLYTSVSLRALRSNRNISHARAARDLDYRPRPFKETLADTLDWFRANGNLPAVAGAVSGGRA